MISLTYGDVKDTIRQFVNEDPSNRDLLMSLLSCIDGEETVVVTTTTVSVQQVVDALNNRKKSQPKVSSDPSTLVPTIKIRSCT